MEMWSVWHLEQSISQQLEGDPSLSLKLKKWLGEDTSLPVLSVWKLYTYSGIQLVQ